MGPRCHLLPAMTPALTSTSIAMLAMKRQTALVIAQTGRAIPLGQTVFDFTRVFWRRRGGDGAV